MSHRTSTVSRHRRVERRSVRRGRLVPDQATLQLGIGAIPARGEALRDKRDLGIHTELFTDTVVDLVESGALTGAEVDQPRKIVSAFVLGTQRLYRFVHDNPMSRCAPSTTPTTPRSFVASPHGRHQLGHRGRPHRPGLADSIGRRLYSGVGGQMDFMRGAALAEEGRAIIALPSTAAGGTVSRIVAACERAPGW